MFSFFRKGKATAKPATAAKPRATTHAPPPPAKAEPKPAPPKAEAIEAGGIQVYESDLQLSAELEQAVMFYANGRVGEATTTLNRFLLNHPDSRDLLPWRMLFDIYEATGQVQPFEDLSLDFAVRFERSPPAWRGISAQDVTQAAAREPLFAFGAALSPQDKARLEHFLEECAATDTVALDFSKTPVPTNEAHARIMLDALSRLVAQGKRVRIVGGEAFLVRLGAFRADGRLSEPAWLLLLLVLQTLGKADAFEAAAVDFAVSFEISPPSYTPPRMPLAEAAPPAEAALCPRGQVFPLSGVLGAGSLGVFEALRQFAKPLDQVEIDLGQVARLDFSIVGMFMDTLIGLNQAGKKVVLREGNEMVNLLLRMVGANQYASLLTRVRK